MVVVWWDGSSEPGQLLGLQHFYLMRNDRSVAPAGQGATHILLSEEISIALIVLRENKSQAEDLIVERPQEAADSGLGRLVHESESAAVDGPDLRPGQQQEEPKKALGVAGQEMHEEAVDHEHVHAHGALADAFEQLLQSWQGAATLAVTGVCGGGDGGGVSARRSKCLVGVTSLLSMLLRKLLWRRGNRGDAASGRPCRGVADIFCLLIGAYLGKLAGWLTRPSSSRVDTRATPEIDALCFWYSSQWSRCRGGRSRVQKPWDPPLRCGPQRVACRQEAQDGQKQDVLLPPGPGLQIIGSGDGSSHVHRRIGTAAAAFPGVSATPSTSLVSFLDLRSWDEPELLQSAGR
eukprot:scaffold2660_cov257-Pinguiococcus_pyrenoidosus.AAC.16